MCSLLLGASCWSFYSVIEQNYFLLATSITVVFFQMCSVCIHVKTKQKNSIKFSDSDTSLPQV